MIPIDEMDNAELLSHLVDKLGIVNILTELAHISQKNSEHAKHILNDKGLALLWSRRMVSVAALRDALSNDLT